MTLTGTSVQLGRRRAVTARTVLLVSMVGVFMAFLDNTTVTIAFGQPPNRGDGGGR